MNALLKKHGHRLNALQARLQQLPDNDRRALLVMSLFLGLVALCFLVVLPALGYYQSQKETLIKQQTLYQWMQQQAPLIKSLPSRIPPSTQQTSPLSTINSSAKAFKLPIKRIQPQADGSVKVWLESVSFSQATQWIEDLEQKSFMIQSLNMDKVSVGIVNLRATLAAA